MAELFKTQFNRNTKQRIFILTDGKVKGSKECVEKISTFCNGQVNMLDGMEGTIDNKVFSFGIGLKADVEFIKQSA